MAAERGSAMPIMIAINGMASASQTAASEAVLGTVTGVLAAGQSAVIDQEAKVECCSPIPITGCNRATIWRWSGA